MQPTNPPQPPPPNPKGNKAKKTGLDGVIIAWSMVSILVNYAGIIMFAFFSTGDEVACGGGVARTACTLPGVDWLGYIVLGCGIMSAMVLTFLIKANKDL